MGWATRTAVGVPVIGRTDGRVVVTDVAEVAVVVKGSFATSSDVIPADVADFIELVVIVVEGNLGLQSGFAT